MMKPLQKFASKKDSVKKNYHHHHIEEQKEFIYYLFNVRTVRKKSRPPDGIQEREAFSGFRKNTRERKQ